MPTLSRSRRRWLTALFFTGVMAGVGFVLVDHSPVGHFRTSDGRLAYEASYAAAMKRLPAPSRTVDLPTDFGTVRAYEFAVARSSSARPRWCCSPAALQACRCGRRTSRTSPRSEPSTPSTRSATPG